MKLPVTQTSPAGGTSFTKTTWLGLTLLILIIQLWMLHKTIQIPQAPQDPVRTRLPSLRSGVTEASEEAASIISLSATADEANKTVPLSDNHDSKSAEIASATPVHIPTPIAREEDEDVPPAVTPATVEDSVPIAAAKSEDIASSSVPKTEQTASDNSTKSEGEGADEDKDLTPLDAALIEKYSEECVELGDHHLEGLFINKDICVSRTRVQQILIDLVVVTSKVFTEHGITHFLESGTLLGSYRHKSVIPFDVDSDMGIDAAGYEKIKSTPIQFPLEYHLQVFDTNMHPAVSRYIELPVRVVHRETALYIDVFVYNDSVDEDGKEWTGPIPSICYINCEKCPRVADGRWELKIPRDWIYPLRDCRFAKHTFKCPAETEKYLEYMFGENYMEPVPFH